jgi:hypothetical protein
MTPLALALVVAATSGVVDAARVHDAVIAPLALNVAIDAEHTWAAREERALGAGASATASLGNYGTFDLSSAIGRDVPLHGDAAGALKLGLSAAWGFALGPITPTIAGVLENGARRVDVALEIAPHDDVTFAVEIEDVAAPQVRITLEWTLGSS